MAAIDYCYEIFYWYRTSLKRDKNLVHQIIVEPKVTKFAGNFCEDGKKRIQNKTVYIVI